MSFSFEIIFQMTAGVMGIGLFVVAFLCMRSKRPWSNWLGGTAGFAAVVLVSYLLSTYFAEYLPMSIASSVYFASIDCMLFCLLVFIYGSNGMIQTTLQQRVIGVILVLGIIDVVLLLINPATHFSMEYTYNPNLAIARWEYAATPLYLCHLIYTYSLVLIICGVLIHKTVNAPSVYRGRYIPVLIVILAIVAVNVLFLFTAHTTLDLSVLLYAFGIAAVYFVTFHYQGKALKNSAQELVIKSLGHPVVLFDNEKRYLASNDAAGFLLEKRIEPEPYLLTQFVRDNRIVSSRLKRGDSDKVSFRWTYRNGDFDTFLF